MSTTIRPLAIDGEVITPADAAYDEARAVFNGMIDRRPALIARCASAADAAIAIAYARERELPLAVRGGGHNVAGSAVCDGGVVIDFSDLREVRVDPQRRRAVAQPGATWYDFDQATQAYGLASTGGLVSSTGVAGFTLGGGIGWLVRKHGLACDNLLAADLVTADGDSVRASDDADADLLWGLRGGGGNFGVVTSFEFQLHPLTQISGGLVAHPRDRAREVLQFFREQCASAPDELTLIAALMTTPEGHPAIGIAACYAGPEAGAAELLRPLKEFGPPVLDQMGPIPYTVLQTALDPMAPRGVQNYWKADFLAELSDEAIDLFVEHANRMTSPLAQIHIHHLGGALRNAPAGAGSAFAHRDASFVYNLVGMWTDPAENDRQITSVRDAFTSLQPVSRGGAYINFLGDDGSERVRAAYGDNYARLSRLKARLDPDNVLRVNQNITPA
ncbi:MAG TPA: FAD-binding oxidoreductase [Candidatus Dormibacteraeota bacterium]|nr:FAD-binding oxidoreductase [Candidatus Dormibacteraeota bacterium]